MDALSNLARIPRLPPRGDVLLAAALMSWAVLEALFGKGPGPMAGRIAFALLITVPLLARRRAPLVVVAILTLATVLWAVHATRAESGTMPFPALLVATFSVALYAPSALLALLGMGAVIAAMLVAFVSKFYAGPPTVGNYTILFFFVCGTWTAGWLIRRRAQLARQAVAESGELARSAVTEERARIARELHDVVAHSVSIIAVQAGAAEELIDRDPGAARAHMSSVRRTARETMTEMRRLLDVLRVEEPSYDPQPGLTRLPDLVDEVRGAGVEVELVEQGERPHLPAGIDLVAFRVVQESLTNVRKHAPGASARVWLRHVPGELDIEVINGAPTPGPIQNGRAGGSGGHGLIGMRERVQLFNGTVEMGATPENGFRVHASLPVDEGGR